MAALVARDEETSESMGVDTIAEFDLAVLPKVQDWRAHDAAATVLLAGLTRHSGDLENLRIVTLGSSPLAAPCVSSGPNRGPAGAPPSTCPAAAL